jgi:hypothetical protein
MRRDVIRLAALAAALSAGIAPTAVAASIGKQRAAAVARHAASARVERFGISYPPSAWKADCARRSSGGWRCAEGTGGQCSGMADISCLR